MSYAPFLHGKKPAWRNRLYFEYAYVRGIRTENVKYVERTDGYPSDFFDIEADPGETRNVIADLIEADPGETRNVIADPAYAKQVDSLRTELAGWFHKAGAP